MWRVLYILFRLVCGINGFTFGGEKDVIIFRKRLSNLLVKNLQLLVFIFYTLIFNRFNGAVEWLHVSKIG